MSLNTQNYRLDIQGLRAIAVLSVVLFHINPILLPGGYIGVDIFFVISGYLIMGFIWRDLKHESFTLLHFYTRRVYRLFPALFTMVIFTTIAAYFILLPSENVLYIKSMLSTLFYVSNFYFYSQASYFNDAMEFYPLLHTWSLSVEEQFYMLFPLLLIWIYRHQAKKIVFLLIVMALLSLLLSQWYVGYDASFAFFSSPTRFFQFITGGIVAIYLQSHKPSKRGNDMAVIVGIIVLLGTLYFYNEHTPFPGLNALLPSFATALVLYYGLQMHLARVILENRYMVFIGNASYSIYLWHWPLIVFYKLKVSPTLSVSEAFLLFTLSIGLGILSWYFIENKTRRHTLSKVTLKPILTVLAGSVIFSALVVSIFHYLPYEKRQYKNKAYQYLDFNTSDFRDGKCFLTSKYNDIKFYDKQECVTYEAGKKNYLLLGDSHAAHYYYAMKSLLHKNETLTQVTSSGCTPIMPYQGIQRCTELMYWAYNTLIPSKHYDTIILSAHWGYVNHQGIVDTVKYLQKYTNRIVVLGPSMQYTQPLPRLLVELKEGEDSNLIYKKAGKLKQLHLIDYAMEHYFRLNKVTYISTLNILCNERGCKSITENGTPVNFDKSHLTNEGAYYILKKIEGNIFDRKK